MRGGARPGQAPPCDNRNHYRANAPVGHCPKCGGVVNGALQARSCREDEHATARRRQRGNHDDLREDPHAGTPVTRTDFIRPYPCRTLAVLVRAAPRS